MFVAYDMCMIFPFIGLWFPVELTLYIISCSGTMELAYELIWCNRTATKRRKTGMAIV